MKVYELIKILSTYAPDATVRIAICGKDIDVFAIAREDAKEGEKLKADVTIQKTIYDILLEDYRHPENTATMRISL